MQNSTQELIDSVLAKQVQLDRCVGQVASVTRCKGGMNMEFEGKLEKREDRYRLVHGMTNLSFTAQAVGSIKWANLGLTPWIELN